MQFLELENANMRSEIDRAKRDKRSAEEELDLLKLHRSDGKDLLHVEEMQRRCLHAERSRDDLLITIQVSQAHEMIHNFREMFSNFM